MKDLSKLTPAQIGPEVYDAVLLGDRLLRLSPEEFDGLATATDIAYEDPDSIPEDLRPIAAVLWDAFHPEQAQAARERRESEVDLQRRAVASGGALTPSDVAAVDRENNPSSLVDDSADAFAAVDQRFGLIPPPVDPIQDERERIKRAEAAADRVIRALPSKVAGWERSSDLGGAVSWISEDGGLCVYATPNWEGIAGTPWNVYENNGDQPYGVLPFDATRYVDKPVEMAVVDYLYHLLPVLARVRRSVLQTIDGDSKVRLFPWPETGSYLGVLFGAGGLTTLFACPMYADGQPDLDNVGEVETIEGLDVDAVNRFFGTTLAPEQFAGR